MSVDERVRSMGIAIPVLPPPVASYVPAVRVGDLVFASGQTPTVDGTLTIQGKVGTDVSLEEAQHAARLAALNCLAEVHGLLGTLDTVVQVVKVTGYVASAPGFGDQPKVVDGASKLFEDIFGDAGRHARAAIGVAELPGGAPVEIDVVVAVTGAT